MARKVRYRFVQNLPRISNPHIAGPGKVWGQQVPCLRDDTPPGPSWSSDLQSGIGSGFLFVLNQQKPTKTTPTPTPLVPSPGRRRKGSDQPNSESPAPHAMIPPRKGGGARQATAYTNWVILKSRKQTSLVQSPFV